MATDTHIVMVPAPPGPPIPTPAPHPFMGTIDARVSSNVNIMGKPAAVVGSMASNAPAHMPAPPGNAFQKPPSNKAKIQLGSATVNINGKPAARNGDKALTCNDPVDQPIGQVIAVGTVTIG